ncbi:50S ribosomal protein L29 [Haloferula sargassicola]|uniref:Large ribosomal subunit protein uL29 n=1 Tax=Haloferula sargassicola TaxID=490096 RepID=A0ABP9UL85_9BACT
MASTKKHPFAELTAKELTAKIGELKEEGFALKLQQTTGQLENTARIRTVRRDIARAMTYLNARQEG